MKIEISISLTCSVIFKKKLSQRRRRYVLLNVALVQNGEDCLFSVCSLSSAKTLFQIPYFTAYEANKPNKI